MVPPRQTDAVKIAAVVSDVDGTLVTDDKALTAPTREAVAELDARGILFTTISSRPPRGQRMLLDGLRITQPFGAFNGGIIARPDLCELKTHLLAPEVARRAVEMLDRLGVEVWVYAHGEWLLRDPGGAHVAHEQHTIGFAPTVVRDFAPHLDAVGKIVGVSDDYSFLERCESKMHNALDAGATVARSQNYYLDMTHPDANKGTALLELAQLLGVPLEHIAVIGDGRNDVAMFERSGFAIAMGNASDSVKGAADAVTTGNNENGVAHAIRDIILNAGPVSRSDAR